MKGTEKYYILISDKTKLGSDHVGFIPNPGKEGVEVLAIFRKMSPIRQNQENPNPSLKLENGYANDNRLLEWSLNSSEGKSSTMNLQLIELTEARSKVLSLRNCIKAKPVKLVTTQNNPERKIDTLIIACEKTAVISSFSESLSGSSISKIKTSVEFTDVVIEKESEKPIEDSKFLKPILDTAQNLQKPKVKTTPASSKAPTEKAGFKAETWFFDCPEGSIATLAPAQYNIFCYGMSACFALFFYMMSVILQMSGY